MATIGELDKRFVKLNDQLDRLYQYLSEYPDAVLQSRAKDGGWSVIQCLDHLRLAEEMSEIYIRKKLSFDPRLVRADRKDRIWRFLLSNYHLWPGKTKAPDFIAQSNLDNTLPLEILIQRWQAQRSSLQTLIRCLPEHRLEEVVYKHPVAGKVSLLTMLHFFGSHIKRHLRQIRRTLAQHSAA